MIKKIIAVLVALSLFVVPVFAHDDNSPGDGLEWLCEEHNCIKHGDDICSACYPVYNSMLRSIGSTQTAISSIRFYGSNGLTYSSSANTPSYDSSTSTYNCTISEYYSSFPGIVFQFGIPNLYNNDGSYSKPTDYPYYILEFDVETVADISMSDDLSQLQFGVTLGNADYFQAVYQKSIGFSEVSTDHYEVVVCGESIRIDQSNYCVYITGSFNTGDVVSIRNISLKSTDNLDDVPAVGPAGPMSPPTESDQWQDDQFAGAVNPELQGKLDNVNTQISDIHEIESGILGQLDEHYTDVAPDRIVFDNSLITAMRWIGTQFEGAYNAVGDVTGLIPVVTLPMFVGLCLLIIGRGGQAMASTRLRIQSKRRDDNA